MTMPKSQYARHVHHHWYGFVMVCCYWKLLTHKTAPNMGIMGKFIGSNSRFANIRKTAIFRKCFRMNPSDYPKKASFGGDLPIWKVLKGIDLPAKIRREWLKLLTNWLRHQRTSEGHQKKLKILKTINFWEDNLVNNLGPQLPLASSSI